MEGQIAMDDICDRFPSEPYRMPRRQPEPFFTELPPCEACGRPAERREWNAEHQLWIGVNCACSELLVPAMVRRILGVTVMYASQNNAAVAPWGDSNPCCGQAPGGLLNWIEAHPWLALALAFGAGFVLTKGGKR
jgi:hypothetical protein